MNADVVIVGSGISGLTSASILARRGKRVVVVEKQPQPGGALRRFKRKGTSFDVGFHYTGLLGEGELLDFLWRYCGVLPGLQPVRLMGGYDHFEFKDLLHPVRGFFSYESFARELKEKFPADHSAIDSYFSAIREICSHVPFYNPELALTPFLRGYKSRPTSLLKFLRSITDNPHLKAVFAAPAFLYGTPVTEGALEVHALVAHGYYNGAYTVEGGGQAIVDTFLAVLEKAGVEVLAGLSVDEILVEDGAAAGVVLSDGQKIAAREIIYTGHPASLLSKVPKGVFRPAYHKRLEGLQNSLSMFAVFGRSEKELNPLSGPLNHFILPPGDDILSKRPATPFAVRPMMMTGTRTTSVEALQQERNGIILLRLGYWQDVERFSASTSGSRPDGYRDLKQRVGTEMIETAERRWGHICGNIEPFAVGTPLTFRDELNAPGGCAYGAMHALEQFNPDVRTKLPGLFLAGQSTLMTGVAGSSISGLVAAGEILGLESLWEDIRR